MSPPDLPPTRPSKRLETASSTEFGEMTLMHQCLIASAKAFEIFFERVKNGPPDEAVEAAIATALFRDGIVQFMACFNSNVAKRNCFLIPSEAFGDIAGWESYYQKLYDLRNAYAAHNHGAQRQYDVFAVVDEHGVIQAFSVAFAMLAGFSILERDQLMYFMDAALRHADARRIEAEDKVLAEVRALTPDEIAALPDAEMIAPSDAQTKMTRDRYRAFLKNDPRYRQGSSN